jgi:predicted molibdopterin-dependent oxidoreductase YjgC
MPVSEGMVVSASSAEVLAFRRNALALLVSEHRGDCLAPCNLVCPAGMDIAKIMNHLSQGEIQQAALLVVSGDSDGHPCSSCPALCEKVCHRKKLDEPLAIRAVMLGLTAGPASNSPPDSSSHQPFSTRLAPISKADAMVLGENARPGGRVVTSSDGTATEAELRPEAERCFQCSCIALKHCRLRITAVDLDVSGKPGRGERRPFTRVQVGEHWRYESGKCIACGLCVAEANARNGALSWDGRGFGVSLRPAIGHTWATALGNDPAAVIKVCPTGALSDTSNR